MNLLSHHACAAHLPRAAQLGSALPDLLPLHRRELRVLPLARAWEQAGAPDPAMAGLIAGIHFHLRVDSRFHRDPLFLDLAGRLQAALRRASATPGLKRFLPAHLLTEMYLDHLLLLGRPGLIEGFYGLFDEAGRGLAEVFAARHVLAETASLRGFLLRFAKERFLEDYRSLEGILHRAQRVLLRCRQRPLERAEAGAVVGLLRGEGDGLYQRLVRFVSGFQDGVESGGAGIGHASSADGSWAEPPPLGESPPQPPLPCGPRHLIAAG